MPNLNTSITCSVESKLNTQHGTPFLMANFIIYLPISIDR